MAGYVIAGRALDKCRAEIAGTAGEYHFDCPLDNVFFDFTGITSEDFRDFVATGADDEAVAAWITENAKEQTIEEVVQWNNDLRYKRISEMPINLQVFLETYIPENIPANRVIAGFALSEKTRTQDTTPTPSITQPKSQPHWV